MMTRSPRPKKTLRTAVDPAVLAVQCSPSAVDMPMAGIDPAPGALDLPEMEQMQTRRLPATDHCPTCGSLLCADCVAGNEGSN
jgi:hypothetical protein